VIVFGKNPPRLISAEKGYDWREFDRWLRNANYTLEAAQSGLVAGQYVSVATSYTILPTDTIVKATVAGITLTLPTEILTSKQLNIDNASTGDITVTGNIEGETSQTVPSDSCMAIYYTGTNWRIT
jgi:hypothetical protein